MKKIYIILSHSGTIPSKLVKLFTLYKYSHVSISFIGVFFKIFNISITRKNYKDCSEFVATVLKEASIFEFDKKIIKPKDFWRLPYDKILYKGKIIDY